MSYAFPPGSAYNRYKVDERVFTIRKDDKAAVIYEFMQVLFAAANAHQDNDDVRELRYIATQILNKNFSDRSIHPMYILQHLNEWAKAAKTEQITGFLAQYKRLPPPQTLEELGYKDLMIESIPDADKKRILAEQIPYADFIRHRSRAFNYPSRPPPRPREPELPDHMKGGRRRKTKKSKRRARKTRRRHK